MRLGLNAYNASVLGLGYYKSNSYVVDTFVSQQTGQKYVLDSTFNENYYMQHRSSQLELNADIIFRTKQKSRWGLYAGVGFSVGTSINSLTNITNYTYSGFNTRLSTATATNYNSYYGNNFGGSTNSEYNSEVVNSDVRTTSANVYLPLGIDFRIGNKRELLEKNAFVYGTTTRYKLYKPKRHKKSYRLYNSSWFRFTC